MYFHEARRVLKDDGTLWLNIGDAYVRDPKKGGSGPGNKNWGHVDGARARLIEVGASYPHLKAKDLAGIPWRLAFALQQVDWYLRCDIIWEKPNKMPESVRDRPTRSHEYIFLLTKSSKYFFDSNAVKEPITCDRKRSSGAMTNTLNKDRNDSDQLVDYRTSNPGTTGRNIRSVWRVNTRPFPHAHFATFPPDLIRPCILAGSADDDVILDPFAGAGTTLLVAQELGRRAMGIELKEEYNEMIVKRLEGPALPKREAINDA